MNKKWVRLKSAGLYVLLTLLLCNVSCGRDNPGQPGDLIDDAEGNLPADITVDTAGYGFHQDTYTYKKTETGVLKLDVFVPEEKAVVFPVIIFFHGGGWKSGKRQYFHRQCQYFAKRGIVAVTADYRFVQEGATGIYGTKEVCIRDAKSAIRWVKGHADELHIDTGKVILGGGSAGGHLATMAALDHTMDDPEDDMTISTRADALVLFNPAYSTSEAAKLEPFHLVSSQMPPVIMFFGSRDKWKQPADTLYAMLRQQGVKSAMWIANDQTHAFFNKDPWNLSTCIKAQAFLVQCDLMKPVDISPVPQGGSLVKAN